MRNTTEVSKTQNNINIDYRFQNALNKYYPKVFNEQPNYY